MPTNPQLFFKRSGEKLLVVAAKVVEDLKVAGTGENALILIDQFNKNFKLGTVASGPRKIRSIGINIKRKENVTVCTDIDDQLASSNEYSSFNST